MYHSSTSEAFDIRNGAKVLKQGFELAPTLFRIFFALVCTLSEQQPKASISGQLFNISRLKAKTRVQEVCLTLTLGDFLFADDAAVTTHTEEELQQLMQRFTVAGLKAIN